MVRPLSSFFLVLVSVRRVDGTGERSRIAHLATAADKEEGRLKTQSIVPASIDNDSAVVKEDQGFPDAKASGSLTCMRWTGGQCSYFACKEERGPYVVCEAGYCMCQPGTCANAEGKCVPNYKGEWLGEYSIRFTKPFLSERPFLGTDEKGLSAASSDASGGIASLAAVSTKDRQWKIAQMPSGHVRLANTMHPESALTIYHNRRRRSFFMQQSVGHDKKMNDNNDLWPMLLKLEAVHPLAATFQIRPTQQNGGGFELWDPEHQVSLASADPESWGDSVVEQGVTECKQSSTWDSDPCEGGRQLISFKPELPGKAIAEVHRARIVEIGRYTWWQTAVFVLLFLCVMMCCNADLFGALFLACLGAKEACENCCAARRREAAIRESVEAHREREHCQLLERIAGLWVLESDVGCFDYEFMTTVEGISIRGRSQGASEWDSTFQGQLVLSGSSDEVGQLCWEDDRDGTRFSLSFENEGDSCDKCSGAANAANGQEVLLTGKRAEPGAEPSAEST